MDAIICGQKKIICLTNKRRKNVAKPMRKLGFYTQYLAKENNVSLITEKEMDIINDKRSKEKQGK